MADAQVLSAESVTNTTAATTTWVDVTSIAAASFTASKKYLILAWIWVNNSSATVSPRMRLVHGTTPTEFTDAFCMREQGGGSQRVHQGWMYTFDMPGTTEDVKIQISSEVTATVTNELAQILAIKLDDDFTTSDWKYTEDTVDYTPTATLTSKASVTFTANGTDTWLLIASAGFDDASVTSDFQMVIDVDGTDEELMQVEGQDTADTNNHHVIFTSIIPASGSRTAAIQLACTTAATHIVPSNRMFALNLSKFAQVGRNKGSAGATFVDTPSWSTNATVGITPTTTGQFVILAGCKHRPTVIANQVNFRLQVNNGAGLASDPAYGDDLPASSGWNTTDRCPNSIMKKRQLDSGASRTINYDWQHETVGDLSTIETPEIIVFSVALTAAAADGRPNQSRFVRQSERAGARAQYS